MIIKATTRFRDLLEDCVREVGDVFTVTKERGEQIIHAGYAEIVKESEAVVTKTDKIPDSDGANGLESVSDAKDGEKPARKAGRPRKATKTD